MRLTELNPRWLSFPDGAGRQGVSFDCPCCRGVRLGVFFVNPLDGPAVDLKELHRARMDDPVLNDVHVGRVLWRRAGDGFEDLTLDPSIDASGFGHWHGHVRNGGIA